MKKQIVVRRSKKLVRITCGPFKNRLICLLKNGFSGWHCRFDDTGEIGYVFRNEIG